MKNRESLARVFAVVLLAALLSACTGTGPVQGERATPEPGLKPLLDADEQYAFARDYAELLLEEGHAAAAEGLLTRLRQARPGDEHLLILLARAYQSQGRDALAHLAWEQAYRLRPDHQHTAAGFARSAVAVAQYAAAEAVYTRWLEQEAPDSPKAATALNNLGYCQLLQRDPARALDYLDRALAIDPLNRRARANRAIALAIAGEQVRAAQEAALLSGRERGAAGGR